MTDPRQFAPPWCVAAHDAILRDGEAVLVTQCSVEGSAPREAGAKMLISREGQWGTIGGGNLEQLAIDQARLLLDRTDPSYLIQDYPLGPLLAQCCGGHVRLLIERLTREDLGWLGLIVARTEGDSPLWLETQLMGAGPRKQALAEQDLPLSLRKQDARGFMDMARNLLTSARPTREACASWLEPLEPARVSLVLFGAGHVGRAVAHICSITELAISWYDSREATVSQAGVTDIAHMTDIESAVSQAPAGAIFLVMTHSHEQDYQLIRAILSRGDHMFCGLIGSKTKRARFIRRLREDGLAVDAIAGLTCPIGLPGVSGKTPAAIAISVAAQLNGLVDARREKS